MRFVSCKIAGFGKFVNTAFALDKNINCLFASNGWGKTTLAAFLECMLYGMDATRSRSVAENDRIRFEPWSGGVYGGSLTFLYRGESYRVERTFGKTASGDTARVYDKNNALCYAFGERAEKLGETLLRMNRESYRRIAHISRLSLSDTALPDDTKTRLLSAFNANTENGASGAMERLDAAERALRAKRRPAKGKLDELDDLIAIYSTRKADCLRDTASLEALTLETNADREKLNALKADEARLQAQAEALGKRNEQLARIATENGLRNKATEAETALANLKAFFGTIEPKEVNIQGIQNAVSEYYELTGNSPTDTDEERLERVRKETEAELLRGQIDELNQTIARYETEIAEAEKKTGAGTRSKPKKRKSTSAVALVIAFTLSIIGATFIDSIPALGYPLLSVGCIGILYAAVVTLRDTRVQKSRADKAILAEYHAALKKRDELFATLRDCATDSAEDRDTEKDTLRVEALKSGIEKYFQNFRFEARYDYRASLTILKERIAAYEAQERFLQDSTALLSALPTEQETAIPDGDPTTVKFELAQTQREKEDLIEKIARSEARISALQSTADELLSCEAELVRLHEEYARLDKRLLAIRTAKEILVKAKERLASRYLEPVERNLRAYSAFFEERKPIRFTANGLPVYEDNGIFRELDYYSAGEKGLAGFCTRLALLESVCEQGEPPVLLIDDPFAELDDAHLKKAKALLVKLAEKYQIVYFTCAQDRVL